MSIVSNLIKKNAKGAIRTASKIGGIAAAGVSLPGVITTGAAIVNLFSKGGGGGSGPGKVNLPGLGGIGGPSGFSLGGHLFGGGTKRIQPGENGACPKGYHLNKNKTSDGLPPHSVCVRNRHVNYANGRAAGRAGRRLRGTVKMLSKSFTLVHGHAKKGKFIPRKRSR